MEVPSYNFTFCRACLEPEETEKFTRVFAENGKIATKIYKLAGVVLFDVDKKIPSLICKKCIDEIEAVEKLKSRILDADDYFIMMTMEAEQKILNKDVKNLIEGKKTSQENLDLYWQTIKTPCSKKIPARSSSTGKVSMKRKSKKNSKRSASTKKKSLVVRAHSYQKENKNLQKRSLEMEMDDIPFDEIFKKPKLSSPNFIPSATPAQLGIKRMLVKSKDFLKGQRMKFSSGGKLSKKINFECNTCEMTFENYQALNQHLPSHKEEDNKANDRSMVNTLNSSYYDDADKLVELKEIKVEIQTVA